MLPHPASDAQVIQVIFEVAEVFKSITRNDFPLHLFRYGDFDPWIEVVAIQYRGRARASLKGLRILCRPA